MAAGRSIWDTFSHEPGRIADGSTGRRGLRPLPPLPRGRGPDGRPGRGRLPLLGLVAAGAAGGPGPGEPEGPGVLRPAGRRAAGGAASRRWPRSTTGTCRSRSRTPAAGWNRDTAERFGGVRRPGRRSARRPGRAVGHRSTNRTWPPCSATPSASTRPGSGCCSTRFPVAHHLLLGHGRAVAALRAAGAKAIGAATNHSPAWPATDTEADRQAAGLYDTLWNRLFADPVLLGSYPEGFAELMPGPVADDLAVIKAPLDFYGVNYYNPTRVADRPRPPPSAGRAELPEEMPFALVRPRGTRALRSGGRWSPTGCTELLRWHDQEVRRGAAAALRHRERLRLRRRPRRRRRGARRGPGPLPRRPPARGAPRRSPRAPTSAATTPGR